MENKKRTGVRKARRIGYVRASPLEPHPERQLEGAGLDRVFTDIVPRLDARRPQLGAALQALRRGDTLVVHSMDRLARSTPDLFQLMRDLNRRGVRVEFVKEGLHFAADESPLVELQLALLDAVAGFERAVARERQREGIEAARARGAYRGRRRALTPAEALRLLEKDRANQGRNRAALAREFGISRETLYQYLRRGT